MDYKVPDVNVSKEIAKTRQFFKNKFLKVQLVFFFLIYLVTYNLHLICGIQTHYIALKIESHLSYCSVQSGAGERHQERKTESFSFLV